MAKKTFYLNFENGLDEQYVNWAKEAVQEFINLFPEYKDNFAVEENNFSYANADVLKTIAEFNKEFYQSRGKVFDEANFWRTFDRLPDGSYKASLQKQIALVSRNGIIDIQKLSSLQADSMANKYGASSPILINITKQKAGGNIRGISSEISVNISAGTCAELGYKGDDLKAYFKDIIIHELGHSFNATHEGRKNCVENLGSHCTDPACLMYEYAYTNESFNRRKKLKEPFCKDCMESMREYMQNTLHFTKTKTQSNDNQLQSVNLQKQNNFANIPYFANLSSEEKKILEAFDKYLQDNNISRDDKDLFFDKMYLIALMRSETNRIGQIPTRFLSPEKFNFKNHCNTDWNINTNLKNLRLRVYEAKKNVLYSSDVWDGRNSFTKDKDGKIAYFASLGQTPKGDELAKRMLDTTDMKTEGEYLSGWIYRIPPSQKRNQKVEQRFAANVFPDKKLFDDLDAFAKKHNAYYKTAPAYNWHKRNDPVVIYCLDKPDKATIDELKTIMAPYIRREKPERMNDMDGTLIADGLITAQEPSLEEINKLLDEIKTYNKALAGTLEFEIGEGNNSDNPLSLGQFEAYKRIFENYKQVFKPLQISRAHQGNDNQQNRTETNTPDEQLLLSGLSDEEKAFLKDYLDYIRSSGIKRSKEDLLWDRVYLLEKFRSQRQNTNAAAQSLKQEFKTIAETFDWKKEEYKNKLPPQTRQKVETFLTQQAGQSIEINDQPLPPTEEKEKNTFYKTQLRGILRDSAKNENLEYCEEPRSKGFKAELKAADGSKTTIEANNSQQISLMAHNEKGEKVVPPFRRFMDIVSYAQLRHSSVSFGEIKTPEFKASLMIACLKAQPPVRMKGAPKMTEEFLNLLNPQTAKALHEAYYSRRIEKELSTYQGLKRSQAERYLELKNQKKPLKPREWSELFYHEDQLVGDIALDDAQRKFKSERPREEEWHQKTGYEPQRVVHYDNKRPGDASWKLHLDVTPNPDEPTTKAVTQYLEKLDMDYKICGGEENGKGITIYVGSYLDTLALSTRLQMEFGDKVKLPARYTDQFNQETEFHNVATGRFMIAANYDPETKKETPVFDEVYPTTVRGISPARLEEHNSTGFLIKAAKQMKLVPEQTPDDYKQITDAKQHYDIDMLENYVSHRLYAQHLGAFYYGDNAERFEKHLFNDKLPEAGSPERTKWDILANKYEQFIKDNCPEKIDLMKKHIENYKPIDFAKENTNQNSRQQEKPDLTQQVIDAKRKKTR